MAESLCEEALSKSSPSTVTSFIEVLLEAIRHDNLQHLRTIFKHFEDDLTSAQLATLLRCSIEYGRVDIAKFLIDDNEHLPGYDSKKSEFINAAIGNSGQTALIDASSRGFKAIVKLLLDHGASVDATNRQGETALMHAAWAGHRQVVGLLLAHGADINRTDVEGRTALHLALCNNQNTTVAMLIDLGAAVHRDEIIANNTNGVDVGDDKIKLLLMGKTSEKFIQDNALKRDRYHLMTFVKHMHNEQ